MLVDAFTYDTLGDGTSGSVRFVHNGQAYLGYYEKVADSDTKFALFFPDRIAGVKKTLLALVIAIVTITIVALITIAVLAAQKLYAPVQKLMTRIHIEENDPQRARDDFRLLGEALDSQQASLATQGAFLHKEHLYRQLHGQGLPMLEANDIVCGEGALGNYERFAVVVLGIDGTASDHQEEPHDLSELSQSLTALAIDGGHPCEAVWDNEELTFVFDLQATGALDLGAFLQWFKDQIELEYRLVVSLYASTIHRGARELPTAYSEATLVREHCALLQKCNTVLGYDALLAQTERGDRVHLDATVFTNMRAFVQCTYRDPNLSAKTVADRFGISQSGVTRAFKKYTGAGFLDYLHGLRLAEACELLRTSDVTLADVAERVGYTNPLTLTRAFKRYIGTTPGEFRRTQEG